MKITFSIDYRTAWGETVYLAGNIPALAAHGDLPGAPLHFDGNERWTLTLDTALPDGGLTYSYVVRHENGYTRHEWGNPRTLHPAPGVQQMEIYDRWQDQPWDKPYYSSAFTRCVNVRDDRQPAAEPVAGMLNIRVQAPMVSPDRVLAISGSIDALGNWNPAKALRLSDGNFPEWSVNIPLRSLTMPFEYKFLLLNKHTGEAVAWEGSDNRHMNITPAAHDEALVLAGMRFVSPLQPWRGAGVAIPVFSIRTNDDYGVGDFLDLEKVIDWAVLTHQRVVQILPINDTTMTHSWEDSYPYNANSNFALHPMYLRIQAMGKLNDAGRQEYFDNLRRELNALPQVDYERVNEAKEQYTRELFRQDGAKVMQTPEFRAFTARNEHWLKPYAAFCVLRDMNGTPEFQRWGEYAIYDEPKIDAFIAAHRDDIDYVYYIQYNLDAQMRQVSEYGRRRGVAIKGDIPIGISRTSVDAWTNPRLFNLDCQAGAPPDDFSVLGQNWGFPTYNWEEMARDGFAWWKARFRKMAEYFDAYRIDHVLGFFRIWQIPMDALHGLLGVFSPALPFTVDELRNDYDFWLDVDLQTKPYIFDWMLGDFFGEYTDEARQRFLEPLGGGRHRLKEEYDTQRKVAAYFAKQPKDERNERLCNALLGLIDQVLFIEDPVEKGKYHPRIAAQFTYTYRALNDYEKWTFDRLYNDFFYRRHNDFWYGKAMWKLPPLIDATDMLVCAEDLGMIPDCVPAVMNALEILSLEIQRMPKDPQASFGNTWGYPYFSVCTTSTHDMAGIRQWWEADPATTQRYYNDVLHEGGAAPQYAEPWICEKIVDMHLKSPSMLCILPLQDWLSMDGTLRRRDPREEQINIPAISRHYWRYRMHLTLEELLTANDYNSRLRDLISWSGR